MGVLIPIIELTIAKTSKKTILCINEKHQQQQQNKLQMIDSLNECALL